MARSKQAKVLTEKQIRAVLSYLESNSRNPERDQVVFLLSFHGLRCKEIANITFSMISDTEGNLTSTISLADEASKGKSGGDIPMSTTLQSALARYIEVRGKEPGYLIRSERADQFSANAISGWFTRLYKGVGFEGAKGHSGRRSWITNAARKISLVGGSMRDVMALARHKNLSSTQVYVDQNTEAQKQVVELIFKGV